MDKYYEKDLTSIEKKKLKKRSFLLYASSYMGLEKSISLKLRRWEFMPRLLPLRITY